MAFVRIIGRWMLVLDVGRFLLLLPGDILCRSVESSANNPRFRGGKINIRVALPAPGAATRFENLRCLLNECTLLLRRELHHAPVLVRNAKRRENLSRDTKIGNISVRPLDCGRNCSSRSPKLIIVKLDSDLSLW